MKISSPLDSVHWEKLSHHKQHIDSEQMLDWFKNEPNRVSRFSIEAAGLHLDFSKNRITNETLQLLVGLAKDQHIESQRDAMFAGELINQTEQRAVLHTALRATSGPSAQIRQNIHAAQDKMKVLCNAVIKGDWKGFSGKPIKQVISIGIGGSFLGPNMVLQALTPYKNHLNIDFIANIDGTDFHETLNGLEPGTTLFIVQSKTFTTQETLENANACKSWLLESGCSEQMLQQHFIGVTTNSELAIQFGINPENIFPMWDWVGGRYSLWSCIGLPIALGIGFESFEQLLLGAEQMDQHFCTAPLEQNMPVIMALLGIWYNNFFNIHEHAVLPYDEYLDGFTKHLQQMDMESNGKSIDNQGNKVTYATGPIIWGGAGTNGQHSYHQLLHQGSQFVPCDFIVPFKTHNRLGNAHDLLVSNCIAQSQALLKGKSQADALEELSEYGLDDDFKQLIAKHKTIPGNRPSNMLTMEQVNPSTLGALIALYEQKVFTQGAIWNINSFDQWGVELGKQLSHAISDQILSKDATLTGFDQSTADIIRRYKESR